MTGLVFGLVSNFMEFTLVVERSCHSSRHFAIGPPIGTSSRDFSPEQPVEVEHQEQKMSLMSQPQSQIWGIRESLVAVLHCMNKQCN
jgi:hypothetical protein